MKWHPSGVNYKKQNSSYRGKFPWNLKGNLVRVSKEFELSEFEFKDVGWNSRETELTGVRVIGVQLYVNVLIVRNFWIGDCLCWFWNVISFRYPLVVHERAYGSYYKSIIAYINDDFYW